MSDLPIHPVIVHFPIVLAFLSPVVIGLVIWATKKGFLNNKAWIFVVLLQVALVGSAFLASELGEMDEERVEKVVTETLIKNHEELAEMFTWGVSAVLLLSIVPLVYKNRREAVLYAVFAGSVLALVPAALAGHSGGELVYKYGAATAYVPTGQHASVSPSSAERGSVGDVGLDDDDD